MNEKQFSLLQNKTIMIIKMLPFHLTVKKVTVLAGGHAAKQSALSLE